MPSPPYSSPDLVVGDVALCRGDRSPTGQRCRDRPWTVLGHRADWTVWGTEPDESWAGFGVTTPSGDHGQTWVVTDVRPDGDRAAESLAADSSAWALDRQDRWFALRVSDHGGAEVLTDRFGTIHVAYAQDGTGVSSFGPSLAPRSPSLDTLAVQGFCLLGWYPGDRTMLDGVRLVRPATRLRISSEGALSEQRWHRWREPDQSIASHREAVEAVAPVLDRVLDRQIEGARVALPISGGLDSRTTVASITRPDRAGPARDLWAFSYGYGADSPELRIAAAVGRARDLDVAALVIDPYLFDDIDRAVTRTEAAEDLTLCRQLAVTDRLRQHADVVVAAHWGDVWFDHAGGEVDDTPAETAHRLIAKSRRPGADWLFRELFPELSAADVAADVTSLIEDEADRLTCLGHGEDRLKALKTDQWSWRWTVTGLRAYQGSLSVRTPFYDPDVADRLWHLDRRLHHGRGVQVAYFNDLAPDLAAIEWEAAGVALPHLQQRWRRLPRRATAAVGRRLRNRATTNQNWQVQFGGATGRDDLRRRLVNGDRPIHSAVDPSAIAALIEDLAPGRDERTAASALGTLLALDAWMERWG